MSTYNVKLYYSVEVEADNELQAYEIACEEMQDNVDMGYCEDVKDMAYTVEEV